MDTMEYMETPEVDTQEHTSRRPRKPRRIKEKGRAKGVKLEERGEKTAGQIVRMLYGQSYGLIRIADRRMVFFHRKDAKAGLFNNLDIGDRVAFELIEDPLTGPRAVRVTRAA